MAVISLASLLRISLALFLFLFTGQASAKQPIKGQHTIPCREVEKFPFNPIGHPLIDVKTDLSDLKRHRYVLDRISNPATFDPNLRFSAVLTEHDHDLKLNLNFSIVPLNKKSTKKLFYFRTIFEVSLGKYLSFAHYLAHFDSCEVNIDMGWDKDTPPVVELFEYRLAKPVKAVSANGDF